MTTSAFFVPGRVPTRLPARQRCLRPLALAVASLCASGALQAAGPVLPVLPSGLQVVQGQATLQTNGRQLSITNSAGALLNWQQFSIGAGDAVRFVQPSASSKVLNRVVGQDPSSILGSLSSNGQVWLLNPNGVLFGATARIDVAGLMASTLQLDNDAWRAGVAQGRFSLAAAAAGAFDAAVVNQGVLRSTSGGQVLLIGGGGGVHNAGLIEAPDGQVVLAAGSQVDLIDTATPRLGLQLRAPQGEVLNLGRLSASGGRIDLQAGLVNQQGIVRADSLAAGPGGQVLISASQGVNLGPASRTSADGVAAGGQVWVDAGAGTLQAAGQVSALGGSGVGGSIALLGHRVGVLDGAVVDASGAAGGGAVRVGGGLRGQEAGWRSAEATYVGRGAVVRADALLDGDGGLVVLWSDKATRAYGSFSARGGSKGGDGGFIETSGGWIDAQPLAVHTSAAAGRAGQWLIDPDDLLISSNISDAGIGAGPDFSTTNGNATLSTFTISQALNANNNVSISTGNSPGNEGRGDITLSNAFLNVAPTQPVSLSINATGSLTMESSSIQTLNAPLTVHLVAGALGGRVGDGDAIGGAIRINSSSIGTAGGDISLGGPSLACGAVLGCAAGNIGAVASFSDGPADGVAIYGSSLRAGGGHIQIDGHSLIAFADTAGVRIADGSQLEASRITIHGTVDSSGDNQGSLRYGVVVSDSSLAATGQLRITGSVHTDQAEGAVAAATGVDIGRNTLVRVGVAGAAPPADGEASSLLIDGMVHELGDADAGALRLGVRIGDNGTQLVALGGAGVTINGNVDAPGSHYGVFLGSDSVTIDASAGSALSLQSGNDVYVSGRLLVPTGGSFDLLAGGGLVIEDALIDGAPAAAALQGQTVAIGTGGTSTRLVFAADAAVSVRASSFVIGFDGGDGGPAQAAGVVIGPAPAKQVQAQKHALDANVPPIDALAVLATGGHLEIAADTVVLGSDVALYAGATDNALHITGSSAGTPVLSFTNLGGATVLRTPNGHWQLEAADSVDSGVGSFQPGDLRADFWQYGAAPGNTTPAAPGNGFLFAALPSIGLQVLGEGAIDKIYDGSDLLDLAGLNLAVAGLRPGQLLAGDLRLQDRNAGAGRAVVPGQGALGNLVVAADGTPIFGYLLDAPALQVNVAPAVLNLSVVQAVDKVYDGNAAASISAWTLSGLFEGDRVSVASGTANFADANVGNAKLVTANVITLGGQDAGNYRLANATASTVANVSPATLRYLADPMTVVAGNALPALSGVVQGFVAGETLASATQGQLLFQTAATAQSAPGRYAVDGSGLVAQNYVFVQAAANATALAINVPPVQLPAAQEPVNTLVTQGAVLAVLTTAQGSSAGVGRTLDALPALQGDNHSGSFGSLDLDSLPAGTLASVLAARDAYKKAVFRDALTVLEANPGAADATGCATAQQAASGQCLMVRPLGTGLDISNARVVERAPVTAPAPVAAPLQAAPAAASPPVAAAARAPAAAPLPQVRALPADLSVSLPPHRSVLRAAVPQIQRKIAVLIGVDRYEDSRIPQLANAVSDVQAMSQAFSQKLGYETLVLQNPGKATIFRALNQLAAQVGPADSVVLYYAGHGERVDKTGLGYWQPADADASRPETWISNADIDRLLRQLPAQQVAMVSDSCFSGSLVSGERIRGVATTADPSGLLGKRAVVVMTSGGNEPVFDSGLNGHSPFAWNLMQSLGQVGSWKPGSSLFEQVRFAVARKLPQRPQYGASSGGGHEAGADYLFEQRQLGR